MRLCPKSKSGGDFFSNSSHNMAKHEQLLEMGEVTIDLENKILMEK